MPSTATITAWNVFAASTIIRSAQVNNNFDLFRGHLISVDPTATALGNLSYDLGSINYNWRAAYLGHNILYGNTTGSIPTVSTTTHYGLYFKNDFKLYKKNSASLENQAIFADDFLVKGDLLTASATYTVARLPIGTDGQVLTADSATTTGMKWAATASAPTSVNDIYNLSLATTVGSNALTIQLKDIDGNDPSAGSPVKISFRNATAGTGTYVQRSITAALSTVISSGSTAGHTDSNNHYLFVYALDNAGTVELAWSSKVFDDGSIQSTTAEGGAGAADSSTTLYSTTARSNVAIRLIGRLKSNQTTAGTWAAVASEISIGKANALMPQYIELGFNAANGYGSDANNKIRKYSNVDTNTGNITYSNSATAGLSVTILTPGRYAIIRSDGSGTGAIYIGVTRNASSVTTAGSSLTATERLNFAKVNAADYAVTLSGTYQLNQGDIIRPHDETNTANWTSSYDTYFKVIWIGW